MIVLLLYLWQIIVLVTFLNKTCLSKSVIPVTISIYNGLGRCLRCDIANSGFFGRWVVCWGAAPAPLLTRLVGWGQSQAMVVIVCERRGGIRLLAHLSMQLGIWHKIVDFLCSTLYWWAEHIRRMWKSFIIDCLIQEINIIIEHIW